ncbi:MAG: zeta toxin family protein [Roseburia sp.]|nr:zeta toxin family protein [Roseburia sp.]
MIDITLDSVRKIEHLYKIESFAFVSEFFNSICKLNKQNVDNSNDGKVIYLITGGIAAGKSTLAYNLITNFHLEKYPYVGTDFFYNLYFSDSVEFEVGYNKARNYTDEILKRYAENGISFIWETVISKQKKIDFLKYCFSLGYKILCFFVGTDNCDVVIKRTEIRHNEGAHFVSVPVIIDRYRKAIDSFVEIKPLISKLVVFDNTDKIELLYYEDNETIFKKIKQPEWLKKVLMING